MQQVVQQAAALPPRLVYLWSRCSSTSILQTVFEWSAKWPDKYRIECWSAGVLVARSRAVSWEEVYAMLDLKHTGARGDLLDWYGGVYTQLCTQKGGAIQI